MSARDEVLNHFAARAASSAVRARPSDARAAVLQHFAAAASSVPRLDLPVQHQLRRILRSMQEFQFEQGRHWQVLSGDTFEEGYSCRVGGDPIYHTICQVAGVHAKRDRVAQAVIEVLNGARSRSALLPAAIRVAEALAAGRARAQCHDGTTVRIEGPILPPNF